MKILVLAVLTGALCTLYACRDVSPQNTDGHSHGPDTHSHDAATAQALSYTVFSDNFELFVEFPPLVAGQLSRFAAHWTRLDGYRPVDSGQVIVQLVAGAGKHAENGSPAPSSPGIFRLSLTPDQPGTYDLRWIIQTGYSEDTVVIPQVVVYPGQADALAAHPPGEEGDGISFLKEQAWKTQFAIAPARSQTIHDVIRTSGEIQPVSGEEAVITATQDGLVFFRSRNVQPGREIRAGEELFTLTTEGLLRGNLEESFTVAQARLERTQADLERAERLLAQEIIGQKEYQRRKMEFEVAQAEFVNISRAYAEEGRVLRAPLSGIVKAVHVRDGQFVREGTALADVSRSRRLLLHADVSQRYLAQLDDVHSAHFRAPYHEEVQTLEEYNGRIVSSGKVIERGGGFVPVFFELDNVGHLVPGSFIEVFLLTTPVEDAVVIPRSALMEDYGMPYVYVQTGGESYERRDVEIGVDDGRQVQVVRGIRAGEWVVTRGAYQIKLASMSSAIPAHGHEH